MKSDGTKNWVELAVTGLLAAGTFVVAQTAQAAHEGEEQCAGVIRAGMNDCATNSNVCHSHVESDANPEAWIYLPKGTCAKIVGAKVVTVVDPTPAAKPQ